MRILKVRGDNYNLGYLLGKNFSDAIKYRIKKFKITKKLIEEKKGYLKKTELLCNSFPNFLKEMHGISNGSNVSFYEILLLNLFGLLEISRCSSIAIKTKKNMFLVHNEDGDNFERKKDFAIIKYETTKNSKPFYFCSYYYPGELLGSTFAWNSYGLIITVNSIRSKMSKIPKIPRVFISRALIECENINQVFKIINKYKVSGGLHYFVADKKNIYSIENFQNKNSVLKVKNVLVHTNHYIHQKFIRKNKPHKNSIIRYNRIMDLLKEYHLYSLIKKIDKKDISKEKKIKKEIINNLLKIMFDRRTKPNSIYNRVSKFKRNSDLNQTLATFLAVNEERHVFNNIKHFK